MSTTSDTTAQPSNTSKSQVPTQSRGETSANLTQSKGLLLTGRVASVDEPVNRSGFAKNAPHAAYSLNFRTFQIFADKKLYNCQDSRNDEKDPAGRVIRQGITMFPTIEEDSMITVRVVDFEIRNGEVKMLSVDTSAL